jgi:hypothetical protein|tara:strand:- start:22345 stop:22773 length:429 start_codon:yes stop_codon:yes gene_type:complete
MRQQKGFYMRIARPLLPRVIVVVMALNISACTTTRAYQPTVNSPPPLLPGKSYQVSFVNGKHEALVVAAVNENGFSDKAGHSHLFSEVDEVAEKHFSVLKTTGAVAAGALVFLVAAGIYLLEKIFEDGGSRGDNASMLMQAK